MNWGTYGILIAFGLFVLLLIFNPRMSCFGKRIRSPFYPLLRKKNRRSKPAPPAEDYGFHLVEGEAKDAAKAAGDKKKAVEKTDDYGFRLDQ
jgi:hypothetical protein